jgi:hypothetical protein
MNSFPRPAVVAALAAVTTLPFSVAASACLLFTAALGIVLHADYVLRRNRVRLPRLAAKPDASGTRPAAPAEHHPLAA